MTELVCIADEGSDRFEQNRLAVDVVCAGDSITGWNNYGPVRAWPYPTYPRFLRELCGPLDLCIADGGIAGEISGNGPGHVRRYLGLFPNSRYFIIGFGTNDLGMWPDLHATSRRIILHIEIMVEAVRQHDKLPMLFNVPYANEAMFSPAMADDTHARRDYHNERLREFCETNAIPLADVRSHLRDEHLGDELHPNEAGARIIAAKVFDVLRSVVEASDESGAA
jgi:lysophospholipase L1-like esterase